MVTTNLIAAGLGCLGGLTRSIIGICKARARKDKIKIGYIARTLKLSASSGTLIGFVLGFNPIISFITGYVGSDIIEGCLFYLKRTELGKKHFDI